MPYIGTSPSNGVRRKHTYTATASQTSFSGAGAEGATLSYTDSNFVDVYQNGVKLSEADYTSTSGTAIVLATGATVSDMIEIVVYDVFSVADTVSKADGGTFDGNVTMAGTNTVTGVSILNGGIDVAGDITLDVGGADIIFKDDGTQIGRIRNVSSGELTFQSDVQDKDIVFNGNDGGSTVTALTLDMSDAGTAIFNHDIKLGDNSKALFGASSDLMILHDGTDSFVQDEGTGNLKIRTNGTAIELKTTADEAMVVANKDGTVDLYHDNSKKFNTQSSGILVTGQCQAIGTNVGPADFRRNGSVGRGVTLNDDGTDIGALYHATGNALGIASINDNSAGLIFASGDSSLFPSKVTSGAITTQDDYVDLGSGSKRFDDIHATNGTIQTSDRNEKQDIEELTDAEKRVAIVAKGLMRKFRWKSRVAEKGDNARIHFGIIAQDLEDAFKAEDLDASKYAMFICTNWWEKEITEPAIEADEKTGVEARQAITWTQEWKTEEEAPKDATKKTRLGVRYSELLAFIISAI